MSPVIKAACAFFVSVALCFVVGCRQEAKPAQLKPAILISKARVALAKGDFEEVQRLTARVPDASTEKQAALLLAGEASAKEDRLDDAVSNYLAAAEIDNQSEDGQLALFSTAEIRLQQCCLSEAESLYRQVYALQPGNALVSERLAFLLSLTG